MGVHDWRKVDAGIWHAFHLLWLGHLQTALNTGILPESYSALAEQQAENPKRKKTRYIPDLVALEIDSGGFGPSNPDGSGNVAVLERPKARQFQEAQVLPHVKQRRIAIRHVSGNRLVALIELISPGNKSSESAMLKIADKSSNLLRMGIHLVIVDLFPAPKREPAGLHGMIWESATGIAVDPPAQPLMLASYEVTEFGLRAYLEPIAVGDSLPEIPLFLRENFHVMLPLASTYEQSFRGMPKDNKYKLTPPPPPISSVPAIP